MAYLYKILMNSRRFGINPESTVTEVCREEIYIDLMRMENLISAEKLTSDYYLVNYTSNSSCCVNDEDWIPPTVHCCSTVSCHYLMRSYSHVSIHLQI